MRLKRIGLAILLLAAPPLASGEAESAPAGNDSTPAPFARLKELEHLLDQSRSEQEEITRKTKSLADETAKVRSDMVAAARAVQENEELLSSLEAQLVDLTANEREKTEALKRRSWQMTGVLTALQRLAWRPTEALLAQPQSPADTVRSAILLRAAVPEIRKSAAELKEDIANLAQLRADIDERRHSAAEATAALAEEHRQLKDLYERKARLQGAAEAAQTAAEARVARLVSEAQDLRDLMQKLEEDRQRRIEEAQAKEAAEKAAREAELSARKAAKEAEEAAVLAAQEAEKAAQKAAQEQKARERMQAEAAREAERKAQAEARAKEMAAEQAAHAVERASREAEAARPMGGRSFSEAKGKLPFPARGKVVEQYNANADAGLGSKGITIQTRGEAQVIAPYDGQVVFAGPFRGYGLLLIIEHADGYHTLLAGMARIDVATGQRLLSGEPVGVMGRGDAPPVLYVELRHNGQPFNPLPWLTAHTAKVHG